MATGTHEGTGAQGASAFKEAELFADRWLGYIHKKELSEEEAKQVIEETRTNFGEHYNRGFLLYRKSVTQAGAWAATEWGGQGAELWDCMGRKMIDCLGGFGLFTHGWNDPTVLDAVRAQLDHTPMPSQELLDPLRPALAKLITSICPGHMKYAFFAASGTEANEGALKLAKLYTGKPGFISAMNGFHGKTLGSLSVSGKAGFRVPMGQLYGPVYHVPFGDANAVERQLEACACAGVGIAAVIMEPIQGEAGAIVPPDDFWPRIREATRKYGCLLIADEVQTGLGRTGRLFGVNHWNVEPDIITVGKAFGGGVMPVSAFISTEEIWQAMMTKFEVGPFIHTTTTGGGPLACAAAIAAIKVILRDRLWEQAEAKGNYLIPKLKEIASRFPTVFKGITGRGLLIGMHFVDSELGHRVASGLFRRGVLVSGTLNNAKSVRIEPPLVISYQQLDTVLARLTESAADAAEWKRKVETDKLTLAEAEAKAVEENDKAAISTEATKPH